MNRKEFAELFAPPCPGADSWAVHCALSVIPPDTPDAHGLAEEASQDVALYFLENRKMLAVAKTPGAVHYVIVRRAIDALRAQGRRAVGIGPDIEEMVAGGLGADADAECDELIDAFLTEFNGSTPARRSLLADLLESSNKHKTTKFHRSREYADYRDDVADRVARLRSPRNEPDDFIDLGRTAYRASPEFAVAKDAANLHNFEQSLADPCRDRTIDDCGASPEEVSFA